MRTYRRETFLAARQAWSDGDFGPEWKAIRIAAAERGYIYPPAGSPDDDRDAERPSQRAIIYRALEDNPKQTVNFAWRSSSWSEVVDRIISFEREMRIDVSAEEREMDEEKWLARRQPAEKLGDILSRVLSKDDAA